VKILLELKLWARAINLFKKSQRGKKRIPVSSPYPGHWQYTFSYRHFLLSTTVRITRLTSKKLKSSGPGSGSMKKNYWDRIRTRTILDLPRLQSGPAGTKKTWPRTSLILTHCLFAFVSLNTPLITTKDFLKTLQEMDGEVLWNWTW
jgi:hypothetical protein